MSDYQEVDGYLKHRTALIGPSVKIGKGCIIHPFTNLYGSVEIGDGTTIGSYTLCGPDVTVGRNCKIGSYVHLMGTIGDGCFVGPGAMFTNDKHPAAVNDNYELLTAKDWVCTPPVLGNRVVIGAQALILPGVKIGDSVFVAAGAVVTKDVEANQTVMGFPARVRVYHEG